MNWVAIILTMAAVSLMAVFYLWSRFHRFAVCKRIAQKNKLLSWGVALIPIVILICLYFYNLFTMLVVVIHLLVIWLIAEFVGWIVKRVTKKEWRVYWQGMGAIAFTFVYLAVGWYLANNVWETDYTITNAKTSNSEGEALRIAMFADSHIGTTFDGEGFAKHMEAVQRTSPDVLVIVGDYVDDDSNRADMVRACKALGDFKCKYGVFYVYGNHDKGYSNYRDFSADDLKNELQANGVTILEDEIADIGKGYQLIGRKDKSAWDRADMETLMTLADPNKFSVVLDHQPSDYNAQARAGADLVLSGHTHGGWLFPIQYIAAKVGPDDREYGMEMRDDTTFIVTSGISDWALPMKTGTKSEFVIIDVE